jgi:ubiquinone/menaquinone biosynthesis C-methylase UbiE
MTPSEATLPCNERTIEAWNTVLFEKFERFRNTLTQGLAIHGSAAIQRHCPRTLRRVVDLGCGYGDSTLEIAAHLQDGAEIVGVDAASRFVDEARRNASKSGVRGCRFVVADVEAAELGGPFELAFSRFGTMFFEQPVRALKNVRSALTPGGVLCMVVWRRREDNAAVHIAESIAREIVPPTEDSSDVTCGPGPFSMSDANVVSDLLLRAGFEQIVLERHDGPMCIGASIEEAVQFALELGPAGEIVRLAREEGERLRPTVAAALAEAFSKRASPEGVVLGSSTWLVTARNPYG